MKTLLIFFFAASQIFAFGQNEFVAVDRKLVENAVSDSKKETFYPKLIRRFNDFDTTLTNEDYRLIYFGYAFQKEYTGQENSGEMDISKALDSSNYSELNKLCDVILKANPISLKANYNKGLALFKLDKNDESYLKYRNRYRKLRDAILSSGNGLSCKSSFKVLYVGDEYEIMYRYFEVSDFKSQSLQYPCDRMKISPSKYFKASDMYFDTSESMMVLEKMLKGK